MRNMEKLMGQKSEVAAEVIKAAPPVTASGLVVAGLPLNDIVLLAALAYVVLQIAYLLYRWRAQHLAGREIEE